jgi:hypothetical protein
MDGAKPIELSSAIGHVSTYKWTLCRAYSGGGGCAQGAVQGHMRMPNVLVAAQRSPEGEPFNRFCYTGGTAREGGARGNEMNKHHRNIEIVTICHKRRHLYSALY